MPTSLPVRNAHEALPTFLFTLLENGEQEQSRNGPVFVYPYPLTTLYSRPAEKVVFWHERDANPYFHFQESMWMIAGRNDVEFPATYAKQLRAYSDDGETLNGAYGFRWRRHFTDGSGPNADLLDQLSWAVRRLRDDPTDRRVVISMWDGNTDPQKADAGSRDVPCNTNIFVAIRQGRLCAQVNCRSNDAFFGAYGANSVHMAFLLEYLAGSVGVPVGWYAQNSFNIHAYSDFYHKVMNERSALTQETSLRHNMTLPTEHKWNPYASGELGERPTFPLMNQADHERFDRELAIFLAGGSTHSDGLTDPFFLNVAAPLRESHAHYRNKDYAAAAQAAQQCAAPDWRKGCLDWLNRRATERAAKTTEQNLADAAG